MDQCRALPVVSDIVNAQIPKLPGCNPVQPYGPMAVMPPPGCPPMTAGFGDIVTTHTPAISGWNYMGCYTQTSDNTPALTSTVMTPQMCQNYCKANGFQIAGLSTGTTCLCDQQITTHTLAGNMGCREYCTGDPSSGCGGSLSKTVSVYGAAVQSTLQWSKYQTGCVTDNSPSRVLSYRDSSSGSSTQTVETCLAICQKLGYAYAGLEYYAECKILLLQLHCIILTCDRLL